MHCRQSTVLYYLGEDAVQRHSNFYDIYALRHNYTNPALEGSAHAMNKP